MQLLRALYLHIEDQTHLRPSTVAAYRSCAREIVRTHGGDALLGQVNWGRIIAETGKERSPGAWYLFFRFLNWLGH